MLTVWPAIVIVPARATLVLRATANGTVPLPVPETAPVSVSHGGAFDTAVQLQAAVVTTATVPVPPASGNAVCEGVTVYEHGAAACVIVISRPATVRTPVRATGTVLAATVKLTAPLPVPPGGGVIVIHGTL